MRFAALILVYHECARCGGSNAIDGLKKLVEIRYKTNKRPSNETNCEKHGKISRFVATVGT